MGRVFFRNNWLGFCKQTPRFVDFVTLTCRQRYEFRHLLRFYHYYHCFACSIISWCTSRRLFEGLVGQVSLLANPAKPRLRQYFQQGLPGNKLDSCRLDSKTQVCAFSIINYSLSIFLMSGITFQLIEGSKVNITVYYLWKTHIIKFQFDKSASLICSGHVNI